MVKTIRNCAVFLLLLCVASLSAVKLTLDPDCDFQIDGFVVFSGNCTCRKANVSQEGYVQWSVIQGSLPQKVRQNLNGSLPKQMRDLDGMYSVLDVSPPYLHAERVTYLCSLVTPSGQSMAAKEFFIKFSYGPETVRMQLAETDGQWCPVVGNPTTVQCDVPVDTVSPRPKFRIAFGPTGQPNDDYIAKLTEDGSLWRLTKVYTPEAPGVHALSCYALNVYFGQVVKTTLTLDISDQPPAPALTVLKTIVRGRDNTLRTEDGQVYGVSCDAAIVPGFRQSDEVVSCGRSPRAVVGTRCSCTVHYIHTSGCVSVATTEVDVIVDEDDDD